MYCIRCGFKNADEMSFCGKCGAPLINSGAAPSEAQPEAVSPSDAAHTAPAEVQMAAATEEPFASPASSLDICPGDAPARSSTRRTGLIIGLIACGVLLIAAAVALVLLFSPGGQISAAGEWHSEQTGQTLVFSDSGIVTITTAGGTVTGRYEFDGKSGQGYITLDGRQIPFSVNGETMAFSDGAGGTNSFEKSGG